MNLNIAICDDNQKIRKQYCDFCKKYYQTRNDLHVNISTFISAEQMLQGTTCFDYIFTDIQLIDMNGLEMIKKIRETNIDVLIVIISGFPEYKNQAYSWHIYDYLDKPVSQKRFEQTLQELDRYFLSRLKRPYHYFHTIEGNIQLPIDQITYFEYINRKICIHTYRNQSFYMYEKIKTLYTIFAPFHFIYPHKAFIVNMDYILRMDTNEILLFDNNTHIPISNLKKKQVRDKFLRYLEEKQK